MGKISKYFLLIFQTILIASCSSVDTSTRPPEVVDFPEVGLDYRVAGTREDTRQATISFFTDKGIPYRQEIQEPHSYVITAYLAEPKTREDRRIRRTAYRVSMRESNTANSQCVSASVTWLVESKGIRERTWRTVESDGAYTPTNLEEVKGLFIKRKCQ